MSLFLHILSLKNVGEERALSLAGKGKRNTLMESSGEVNSSPEGTGFKFRLMRYFEISSLSLSSAEFREAYY
jgi:hypothetical protein